MPPVVEKQVRHRPGPLKQSNKPHKGGRSKVKRHDKGKLGVKATSRHRKHHMNRVDRRNQMNQIRKTKREEVLKLKGRLAGHEAAPILSMILSLDDSVDPTKFLDNLKSCDDELVITQSSLGQCHMICPRLKQRFAFTIPNKSDMHSVMDALKISETMLLLHTPNAPDEYTEMLLSVIMAHALPTPVHVIQGLEELNPKKKSECKKHILKMIETRFPDAKLHHADTQQELQLLLRQIGNQKQRVVGFRDNRFHLLAEDIDFDPGDSDSGTGTLKVRGYVRGQPLNVNGLVHIPGWGTYQMSRLYYELDPHAPKSNNLTILETVEEADPVEQESLQSEVIPDPMEGEQTWPTQEELDEADMLPKKVAKKVAEGTSVTDLTRLNFAFALKTQM